LDLTVGACAALESGGVPIHFGRFEFDPVRGRLCKSGRVIRVQPQPLTVLRALIARPGETVTRRELHAALWPDGTNVEFDAALNTAVRKLRRVLGDSATEPQFIQTVPGVGYRFIGEIEVTPPPRRSAAEGAPARVDQTIGRNQVLVPEARSVNWSQLAAVLVLVLSTTLIPSSSPAPSAAFLLIREGVRLTKDTPASILEARSRFEMAASTDPTSAAAWGWLAFTEARLAFSTESPSDERYVSARAAAQRALALDGRTWMAHAAMAYVEAGQAANKEGAIAAFDRAIEQGATERRVFIDYACVLKDVGRPAKSLEIIEAALARTPSSAVLRAHRGLYLHAVRRYEEEMPALLDAVAVDPRSAEAFFHLGLGYARRQQYAPSVAALKRAVVLSNGLPRFRMWLERIAMEAAAQLPQQTHRLQRQS
jgi:DNA-binding winged helix-turn-helix (wHTH) protein/Tfp pilus assembly protein PilF